MGKDISVQESIRLNKEASKKLKGLMVDLEKASKGAHDALEKFKKKYDKELSGPIQNKEKIDQEVQEKLEIFKEKLTKDIGDALERSRLQSNTEKVSAKIKNIKKMI